MYDCMYIKAAFLFVNCTDLFDTQSLSDLLKAHKDQMVQSPRSQLVVSVYCLKIRRKRVYEHKMTALSVNQLLTRVDRYESFCNFSAENCQ